MDFTWTTALPIGALAVLGAVVPVLLARRFPDTLAGLARALVVSIVLLILIGTGLFVLLYRDAGLDLSVVAERPGAAARHFLTLGLKSGLVWAPILAVTALALAQGVEARRGQAMAARDSDD